MTTKQAEKQNAVKQHYAMAREKRARVEDLQLEVEGTRQKLQHLNERYEKAVMDGTDSEVEKLFNEIEQAQKALRAGEHKLKTLASVTESHIREDALEVVRKYGREAVDPYIDRMKDVLYQIEDAKQEYLKKLIPLLDNQRTITDEYDDERDEYAHLLRRYKVEPEDFSKEKLYDGRNSFNGGRGLIRTIELGLNGQGGGLVERALQEAAGGSPAIDSKTIQEYREQNKGGKN